MMMMQEEPAFVTILLQTFKDILNEVQSLKDRINSLEARHEEDIERLALDIAFDRQRLAKLEKPKLQPLQKDRGDPESAAICQRREDVKQRCTSKDAFEPF